MTNFKTREEMEDIKEEVEMRFLREQRYLYVTELVKILTWFKEKFPKRNLRWVSGMGVHFWVLDNEQLEWDAYITVWTNHGWDKHIEEPPKDRYGKVLWPCWDFFMSIHDLTSTMGQWIDTGDMSTDDV